MAKKHLQVFSQMWTGVTQGADVHLVASLACNKTVPELQMTERVMKQLVSNILAESVTLAK